MARGGDRRWTVAGLALRRDWSAAPMIGLTLPSLAMGGRLRLALLQAVGGGGSSPCD
jgi:hypothetical protein